MVLLVLSGVVVAAEFGLRSRFGEIEKITGTAAWKPHTGEMGGNGNWETYHERLGWIPSPNYRSEPAAPFPFTTNSQSLRGKVEYPVTAPAGKKRIAVFGDSCAFGSEVGDDETIPHYLQRDLVDCEVLNFGVPGYGFGQAALRLEEHGFAFHPDLVVMILLLPSDTARDLMDHFTHPKPKFAVQDSRLVVQNVPVPIDFRQPWLLRHSYTAAWLFGRPRELRVDDTWLNAAQVAQAVQRRIQEGCDSRNIRVLEVHIVVPSYIRKMAEDAEEARMMNDLNFHLHRGNVEVLDLLPSLRAAYDEFGNKLEAPSGHWSAKGNQRIARDIAQYIARQFPDAFSLANGRR